jgi:hypothetical protein
MDLPDVRAEPRLEIVIRAGKFAEELGCAGAIEDDDRELATVRVLLELRRVCRQGVALVHFLELRFARAGELTDPGLPGLALRGLDGCGKGLHVITPCSSAMFRPNVGESVRPWQRAPSPKCSVRKVARDVHDIRGLGYLE